MTETSLLPSLPKVVGSLTAIVFGVSLLNACTNQAAGGIDCLAAIEFSGSTYLSDRVLATEGSTKQASETYGETIGSASEKPCDPDTKPETWAAFRVDGVDPSDALIVAHGGTELYVRDGLASTQYPDALKSFLRKNPGADNL